MVVNSSFPSQKRYNDIITQKKIKASKGLKSILGINRMHLIFLILFLFHIKWVIFRLSHLQMISLSLLKEIRAHACNKRPYDHSFCTNHSQPVRGHKLIQSSMDFIPRKMNKCTKAPIRKHASCFMTPEIICDPR